MTPSNIPDVLDHLERDIRPKGNQIDNRRAKFPTRPQENDSPELGAVNVTVTKREDGGDLK